jgi:hypothetical protein
MLNIQHSGVIRLAENSCRFGKRCDELFIEQDADRDPVLKAGTGAIHVGVWLRHGALTTRMAAGSHGPLDCIAYRAAAEG